MEKVKLTRIQAAGIQEIKDIDYVINIHALNKRPDSPLAGLETSKVARALYVGYEVEPEFEVGKYIYHIAARVTRKITKIAENTVEVTDGENGYAWDKNHIRHATPEEIKEEKERRFWAKHGRELGELKVGDVIVSNSDGKDWSIVREVKHNIFKVWSFNDETEWVSDLNHVIDNFNIVCFAEDRKDVDDE